jgi:hypothetical protein
VCDGMENGSEMASSALNGNVVELVLSEVLWMQCLMDSQPTTW